MVLCEFRGTSEGNLRNMTVLFGRYFTILPRIVCGSFGRLGGGEFGLKGGVVVV